MPKQIAMTPVNDYPDCKLDIAREGSVEVHQTRWGGRVIDLYAEEYDSADSPPEGENVVAYDVHVRLHGDTRGWEEIEGLAPCWSTRGDVAWLLEQAQDADPWGLWAGCGRTQH